jgi:hypothetical protein
MSQLVEIDRRLGSIVAWLGAERGGSSGDVNTLIRILQAALRSCETSKNEPNIHALMDAYNNCLEFINQSAGELRHIHSVVSIMSHNPSLLESIMSSRRSIARDLGVMNTYIEQNKDKVKQMIGAPKK